jgi:hypothetical protein
MPVEPFQHDGAARRRHIVRPGQQQGRFAAVAADHADALGADRDRQMSKSGRPSGAAADSGSIVQMAGMSHRDGGGSSGSAFFRCSILPPVTKAARSGAAARDMQASDMAHDRPLTEGETRLCASMFGGAIDYSLARVANRKWIFFQPSNTIMAPLGTIHFHPRSGLYHEDFSLSPIGVQGLFIHEMVHVWQHQKGIFLPIRRHPFCRYDYAIRPGRRFERYGLEQQAELVRHAFLLRHKVTIQGAPPLAQYETILPFKPA